MSQAVAELLNAALALSEAERAELSELIAASLAAPTTTLHPAWSAEVRRRAEEVDSGKVQPIPWQEVQRKAQELLDSPGSADG